MYSYMKTYPPGNQLKLLWPQGLRTWPPFEVCGPKVGVYGGNVGSG